MPGDLKIFITQKQIRKLVVQSIQKNLNPVGRCVKKKMTTIF